MGKVNPSFLFLSLPSFPFPWPALVLGALAGKGVKSQAGDTCPHR